MYSLCDFKLGMGSQRKKSYLTTINKILSDFKVELLVPVMKSTKQITKISQLNNILKMLMKMRENIWRKLLGVRFLSNLGLCVRCVPCEDVDAIMVFELS